MRGLVIKKASTHVQKIHSTTSLSKTLSIQAYLLARQSDASHQLSQRIQCMFFLATPHRGSDSARLLNNLLRASGWLNGRQYISDIARNSLSVQIINDEFRASADELRLWSFYETLKTKIGSISSVLIVDRDSAVIGSSFAAS